MHKWFDPSLKMNNALGDYNLGDARFGASGSSKMKNYDRGARAFQNRKYDGGRAVNFKSVDWREEFMKSMTFELSTVYS